ncbi:MAG: extracellular solute-binding protein [Clostridia bacterium]|nr:extracellular solute-binding protein [Clostridia bacterium]
MKRITAALLLLSLILSAASCSQSTPETTAPETTAEVTQTEAQETRESALPEKMDFEGTQITILCREDEANTSYINEFGALAETGDVINDAIYMRNRLVEERLNVIINPFNMDGYYDNRKEFLDKVRNSVSAGDEGYDLVAGYAAYISTLATEGMLLNLADAPYIDYSMPWWNHSIIEEAGINGKNYFVTGDIGISYLGSAFVTYYNKMLAEDLGITGLYDLVREGKWTKEKVSEYVKMASYDLNGDGKLDFDSDRWGFAANQASEYLSAYDIRLTDYENGIPVLDIDVEKGVAALEWLQAFFYENEGAAPMNTVSASHTISLEMFESGRCLFYNSHLGRMIYLRGMEDDFGVLPIWKWDENQENYMTQTHDGISLFCVPVSCKNFDAVSAAMEALAEEGSYSVLPTFYDVALQSKFARDEESEEMMDLIKDSIVFRTEMVYSANLDLLHNLLNVLAKKSTINFATYHAKNADRWQKMMDTLIDTLSALDH